MSEWLISRDMNMTRANVVGNLLHPENWGKKKNPAATPSALADWGFVIGRDPSPLGETLVAGTLSWQEACILSLAKRGPGDGDAPVKPFVAMMKVLAVLQGKPGAKLKFTARGFTRLSAITSYADITDEFCLGINDPDKTGEPALSNYRDIWLNALAESGLFIRNDDDYELIVSDAVMAFVSQVAKFGEKISLCPSKRNNSDAYYAYMGAVETGLPEIFDLMDSNVIWNVLPHFQKIGTAYSAKIQEKASQLITYGAPGTGKSHEIDNRTDESNSIRVTFHPDTDYAAFVGTYKPTMDEQERYALDATGKTHKIEAKEKSIVYSFVPQAFMKAYVEAWRRYTNAGLQGDAKTYYLVIEEINRGNCAQIFGDLFQLLDRADNGFSAYAITPDDDIQKFLEKDNKYKLADISLSEDIKKETETGEKVIATAADIKTGKKLVLPPNLCIWATMNTSDQSLFPIDSAFKRRWDWEYVPIEDANQNWKIDVGGVKYNWWSFLEKINYVIATETSSEDKQLGYFFVKAKDKVIDAKTFVSKVIFYLWGDVFKDNLPDEDAFKYTFKKDGKDDKRLIRFADFYHPEADNTKEQWRDKLLTSFLEALKVEKESPADNDSGQGSSNANGGDAKADE